MGAAMTSSAAAGPVCTEASAPTTRSETSAPGSLSATVYRPSCGVSCSSARALLMETALIDRGSPCRRRSSAYTPRCARAKASEAEMGDRWRRGAVIGRSLSRVRERRACLPPDVAVATSPFHTGALRVPCSVGRRAVPSARDDPHVAERAGVHAATVSRTINVPEKVAPATRRRVEQAVRDLGFVPNRAARGLITGRTGNIAVIVPDITNPHFASLVRAVERSARQADLQVLLVDTGEHPDEEVRAARTMFRDVDGFVVLSPRRLHRELDALGAKPAVFVNRPVRQHASILVQDGAGGRDALHHLAALGHRRLVFLGGPRGSWAAGERRDAVRRTSRAIGIEVEEIAVRRAPTFEAAVDAVPAIMVSTATAVMAFNDQMALGVIAGLSRLGISVPGDVSVVGFDDVPMAAMVAPAAHHHQSCRRARPGPLPWRCWARSPSTKELVGELVVRHSTGPRALTPSQRRRSSWAASFGRRSLVNTPFLLPSTRMKEGPVGEVAQSSRRAPRRRHRPGRTPGGTSSSSAAWYSSLHRAPSVVWRPAMRLRAVLGHDDRLAVPARPRRQLGFEAAFGRVEVAGLDVPSVVAVDHDDVRQFGDRAGVGEREHHVDEADRAAGVGASRGGKQGLEVTAGGLGVRFGLVGEAPEDDAWVVLVPRDQLLDGLPVRLPVRGPDRLLGERRLRSAEEQPTPDPEVEPDGRRLVDDDDAQSVGVVEHLLRVGVVARSGTSWRRSTTAARSRAPSPRRRDPGRAR